MVNRDLMLKWIKALRSGDYPQIRGFLHTTEGLDALGVLCDIVDPQGWDIENPHHSAASRYYPARTFYDFTWKGVSSTYVLPEPLQDYLGVYHNFCYQMVECNDKRGMDFNQIADMLERIYIVN